MRHSGRLCDYISQTMAAEAVCRELEAYAILIGCTVRQDEVLCTNEQATKLAAWWSKRTAQPLVVGPGRIRT